ncbi:hypothetical protein TCE0_060r19472, partial [Talaromyces pinophilus]
SFQKLKF